MRMCVCPIVVHVQHMRVSAMVACCAWRAEGVLTMPCESVNRRLEIISTLTPLFKVHALPCNILPWLPPYGALATHCPTHPTPFTPSAD